MASASLDDTRRRRTNPPVFQLCSSPPRAGLCEGGLTRLRLAVKGNAAPQYGRRRSCLPRRYTCWAVADSFPGPRARRSCARLRSKQRRITAGFGDSQTRVPSLPVTSLRCTLPNLILHLSHLVEAWARLRWSGPPACCYYWPPQESGHALAQITTIQRVDQTVRLRQSTCMPRE